MGFGDLKSRSGLQVLNDFLADKSYIEGYVPSQADTAVFACLSGPPSADLEHALRWYQHIRSYDTSSLPGVRRPISELGPPGPGSNSAPSTGASKQQQEEEEEDIDLFGSDDDEGEEARKVKEERLAQYAAKKSKKPTVIAKSSIVLDVKPWDDETDMALLEAAVRSVAMDGLVWGVSKLVPVGYGIKKLQIQCVVEDDKVSVDLLEEAIVAFEDHVQSVDVAAFNKI